MGYVALAMIIGPFPLDVGLL